MALFGTHILIVGGTKGIGHATAIAALAAGTRVTATGRSAKSLAKRPEGVAGAALDFTDPSSVTALAERLASVNHIVLSASDAVACGGFTEIAENALRAAFDAKFWGYWRVIRALAPKLSAQGSITLVTGAAARAALPETSGLAAVNGALEAMTRVLVVELAPHRVNTVSPGMFAAIAAKLPVGRIAPHDIAQAILLAAANSFITGATLDVDGGAHLAR